MARAWIPFAALWLAACTGGSSPGPVDTGRTETSPRAQPAPPPLKADPTTIVELRPQFGAIGPAGAAPHKVTVRFGHAPIEPDDVGPLTADFPAFEPPVEGSWEWTAPDQLAFTPDEGFAPGTRYTLTTTKLDTRWGTLSAGPWAHGFETPAFEVIAARIARLHPEHVELAVAFSGPVDPSAERQIDIEANGRAVERTSVDSPRSNALRFRIPRSALPRGEISLDVRVRAGAKSRIDPGAVAGPSEDRLALDTSLKPMEIRHTELKEATDGYFVEILCHDAAVGEEEYYWDSQTYESYYLSERCVLSPDALSSVRFEPEVPGMYVAEARRGFRIFGDFPRGELEMTVDAGAFTEAGGVLGEGYSQGFTVRTRSPRTELLAKNGRYLPRSAWTNLPVRHLNTDAVHLEIRHVPPQNLPFWLSDDDETTTSRTADRVAEKEIAVDNPIDRVLTSWIDVASLVPSDSQGLFEIRVRPVVPEAPERGAAAPPVDTGWEARRAREIEEERRRGTGDVSRIVLTDLQLVAKADEVPEDAPWADRITAWVLDASDHGPATGVEVDVIRPSGFVMATCRTGFDGSCVLDLPATDATDTTPPLALVARKGQELTYLKFSDLEVPVSESRVGGDAWTGGSPYSASLYPDRGVYRPGDTAHLSMILRNRAHKAPKKAIPARLVLTDPRGKRVKSVALAPNEVGLATYDLHLPAFAPTGRWTAAIEIGDDRVQTLDLAVEEFVPERMKVEASLREEGGLATELFTVDVDARYLFGGSAEGSRTDVTCAVRAGSFIPAENQQLHYGAVFLGTDKAPRETRASERSVVLDADGSASAQCGGLAEGYPVTGTLTADVAVFEAGSGRTSRATASIPVHPETFYIGLDASTDAFQAGERVTFRGKVVDWQGKAGAFAERLSVTAYRLEEEYGWWWWGDRSEEAYDLYLRRIEESAQTVAVGADGSFDFALTPGRDAAGYLVRVSSGGARTDYRLTGEGRRYAWSGGASHVDRTPRPGKPTSLAIALPEAIEVGKPATAQLQVPFDGKVLLTVETHELLRHEWRDVKAGEASWEFTVSEFVPNVYVSAFLVKDPKLDSPEGYAPERAFGVESVRVKPDAYALDVALDAPREVRSNSPLEITVDVGAPEGWVTVAAVDEGILQLTRFESPDPIEDLFPKHRLGVRSFETIGWSLLMPAGPSSRHGGDGPGAGGRVQPVKPVALWSGPVQADANGKARITLDVPQYRGELRVMAVAATGDRVGAADRAVTVRDPLILQTTLPRFLTNGDVFQIPVFVTNMSGQDRDVTVSLEVERLAWPGMPDDPSAPPPVVFVGEQSGSRRIANGKSETVAFHALADGIYGAATFRVKVESDGLVSYEELDVPFLPAGPREQRIDKVTLAKGTLDLDPHLEGWVPTSEQSTFWVTSNPYGEQMGHLKSLLGYPHGCIEQTTSKTRPLLFVRNLLPAVAPPSQGDTVEKMVMRGVDRVLSMQTPSGGFGYWPGARQADPWGTVYATHMLVDARDAQYDVPQDRIDDALDYIEDLVRQAERGQTRPGYSHAEPYAHYVLAVAQRGKKARIQALLGSRQWDQGQEIEQAYLLKAALYLSGDRRYESDLRDPTIGTAKERRESRYSFYSRLRRQGLMLSVYHDLFGPGDGAEGLANAVARGLAGKSRLYTTQEVVWGVTALGKRVQGGQVSPDDARLLDGKTALAQVAPAAGTKSHEPRWAVPRASERDLELEVGAVTGDVFLVIRSEGVAVAGTYRTGGAGLTVARTYKNAGGAIVDPSRIALGDVIYTHIAVKNTSGETLDNLALVDRFAAGWEIENPNLGRSSTVSWIDRSKLWSADHLDLRDDRLTLFGSLAPGEEREVVYAQRAVTAGEFTSPPVEVEAMYDPSIWARQRGPKVVVKGPWEDVLL